MNKLEQYQQLKGKVEKRRRDVDRADGARQQLLGQLRKEFGVDTVKEAVELLRKSKAELDRLEKKFADDLKVFDDEWWESLRGDV